MDAVVSTVSINLFSIWNLKWQRYIQGIVFQIFNFDWRIKIDYFDSNQTLRRLSKTKPIQSIIIRDLINHTMKLKLNTLNLQWDQAIDWNDQSYFNEFLTIAIDYAQARFYVYLLRKLVQNVKFHHKNWFHSIRSKWIFFGEIIE